MQKEFQQWTAAYLTANEQGEPVIFAKLRGIIRNMQDNCLKEIIFSQLFMIIQTLKVLNAVSGNTFKIRVKKLLAILYNDNNHLEKLTDQIMQIIGQTQQQVQARGGMQVIQPNRKVRRGPPAGCSIR